MNEIANKKLEILNFTQSDSFNIDGLADKLNELTRLASGNDEDSTVDEVISTPSLGKTMKVKARIRSVGKYDPSIIVTDELLNIHCEMCIGCESFSLKAGDCTNIDKLDYAMDNGKCSHWQGI
jgi:hypothetical protein